MPQLIKEKKSFLVEGFISVDGHALPNFKIGYETYGELAADTDNAILICHYFSGTSHCSGKYHPDSETPGYWDNFIGPGKAIDTTKYFVIAVDSLTNVCANDPLVKTVGPHAIDPSTGEPFGDSFPILRVDDWVAVQKRVIESFGVATLKAIAGPSGGSVQAATWAANYPDSVERIIMAISPGHYMNPWILAMLKSWIVPIKLDANWNHGNYYNGPLPIDGLRCSIELIQVMGMGFGNLESLYDRRWADNSEDPAQSIDNEFEVEKAFHEQSGIKAQIFDANCLIYTVKAFQLYDLRNKLENIKAKVLLLPASSDMIFPPSLSYTTKEAMESVGIDVELYEIEGTGGHYDGLSEIHQHQDKVVAFLGK
ncbi:MAG: homoserine O-acetyltransferase [Cellvibrionaceae bacterium]